MSKFQLTGKLPGIGPGMFFLLAAYAIGLGVLYGLTDDDRAGLVLLLLSGVASGGFALWLVLVGDRPVAAPAAAAADADSGSSEDPPPYLPTASLAPLLMGAGATLTVAGIALGLWVLLPGLVLLGWGVSAFARQSRDRA